MDVLSDAVAAMRTGRPQASRILKRGTWGVRFAPLRGAGHSAGFHVVQHGSCWLLPPGPGRQPLHLRTGDAVFLPTGAAHALADSPHTPTTPVRPQPDGSWAVRRDGDPPERTPGCTVLLCGSYRLDRANRHPLLAEMPDVLHLPARRGTNTALHAGVELLGAELVERRPGADAVVPALLDMLLLHMLRAWLEQAPAPAPTGGAGWGAALSDPAVAGALQLIHESPQLPWTVEELGARVGLSRAAFARRFAALVGQPPLAYLTWWRMTRAGRMLRGGDAPLRTVATAAGYSSEFAFAKAFKREYGTSPGAYRRGDGSIFAGRRGAAARRATLPGTRPSVARALLRGGVDDMVRAVDPEAFTAPGQDTFTPPAHSG